jgi:hypothetical protein
MNIGGVRGGVLRYLLINSRLYVAKSYGGGLKLRDGLDLFVEYLSHRI